MNDAGAPGPDKRPLTADSGAGYDAQTVLRGEQGPPDMDTVWRWLLAVLALCVVSLVDGAAVGEARPCAGNVTDCRWREGAERRSSCALNGTQADCQLRGLSGVPADLPATTRALHLDANELSALHGASLAHVPRLRALHAKLCRLRALPPGLFAGLPHLGHVDLAFNLISRLEPDTFSANPRLQTLNLAFNNLANITSETFRHNSLLKHLDLSFNELNTLPEDTFVHLPYLEHLLLPGNGLQVLPDRLFVSNTRISFLDISHNALTSLGTTTFRRLKHLKILKASDNKLVQLEPTLLEANFLLSEVWVHNNRLTSLSAQLLGATQIALLSLHDNPWRCDCALKAFLEDVHGRGASLVAATECASPPGMAKKDVILLFHDQFTCNDTLHQ